MSNFKDGFSKSINNIGGISGSFEGTGYASNVQTAIDDAIHSLKTEATHRENVSADYLKGWLAEQWHAETLKVNGQARGENDIWANVSGNNRPGEDIIYGNSDVSKIAEVKYYKTGADTAKAVSRPEYTGKEKIIPSDQKNDIQEVAQKLADKNLTNRPEQSTHYQDTANHSNDRLEVDDVTSKPLDEITAKEMAKDFKKNHDINTDKYGLNTESFVEWSDIARQSGEAALHAAALSAALTAAPHIWATLKEYIDNGEINPDALMKKGVSVLHGAGTAGLRGGIAAALTASCKTGLMGDSLQSISPVAIGMATTMTINVINYSIQLHRGKLSKQEFTHNCLRDSFVLSSGMLGATVGQIIIPIPMLGALVGNLVGSTLGAVTFEGVNQAILGICVESGWTFFGIVKQDYIVSEDVLKQAGYDLFNRRSFSIQSFSTNSFNTQSFKVNSLSFTPVRRGVISCNVVGNL
jgi:hypothetical protein